MKYLLHTLSVTIILLLSACNRFLDVPPPGSEIISTKAFATDQSASLTVAGLYSDMMNGFGPMNGYMSKYPGLYSDELSKTTMNNADTVYLLSSIPKTDAKVSDMWTFMYRYIGEANAIIEGLNASTGISRSAHVTLSAQAMFVRALNYFYLVNLFGNVPLVISTDPQQTAAQGRSSVSQVYQQIISDLQYAQAWLPNSYGNTDSLQPGRIWATHWAATALLSRVYLYQLDWSNAESLATAVIEKGPFSLTDSPNHVFLPKSNETILQFQPAGNAYNTGDGGLFLAPSKPPALVVTGGLLNAFETTDARKQAWIKTVPLNGQNYYVPYKYKVYQSGPGLPYQEYYIVLRLAEQYLIRAEARAQLGNLAGAISDLNNIRLRAALAPLPATLTQQQLLQAIETECRLEFFAEWGHRWFDLKRLPAGNGASNTGRSMADAILSTTKTATWHASGLLWPIPAVEIGRNQNLVQNPGY